MFEIRLRVLDDGQGSFLGIVEGFPAVIAFGRTAAQVEAEAIQALVEHLEGLKQPERTRIQLDDLPTVRTVRLFLRPCQG